MAINQKFSYVPLSREDSPNGRKYVDPTGNKLPSVTTILGSTKPEEDKQGLIEWRKRVGYSKALEITQEAAGRGTRLHKWLENYVIDGFLGQPGSNPYSKQSHKMAETIINSGLVNCDEFWGTEVPLYFPSCYAGTTDLVGIHKNAEAIMDFKQTNKPKKQEWITDYFLQLVAYAECHNELHGTSINKGVVFMCSSDYQYQEFVIDGAEFDYFKNMWWQRVEAYYVKTM